MGIFDNPMAMGDMFGATNPFGNQPSAQSSPMHTMMQMRAMRYMREPVNNAHIGRAPGQGRGMGMQGMGGTDGSPMDYSQFTYNPQAHQAASDFLGQYGLSPLAPDQVQNNTILPNSGFFGRHSRLSGALEGGIYGAAASHGADTWGEGISSVANSMLAGPQMKRAAWERQFAAPFQAGSMFEQMQDSAQKRDLQGMDIELRRAQIEKLKNTPDPKVFHSMGVSQNDPYVYSQDEQSGQGIWDKNPGYNPKAAKEATMSDTRKAFTAQYGDEPEDGGVKDKHGLTSRQRWGSKFASFQVQQSTNKNIIPHEINRNADEPRNIANKNLDAGRSEMEKDVERMQSESSIKQSVSALASADGYKQPKSVYEGQARDQAQKNVAQRKAKFQSDFPAAGLSPIPGSGTSQGKVQVKERTWNPNTGKLE